MVGSSVGSVGSQPAMVLIIDPEPGSQRAMRARLVGLGYTARGADDYEAAASIVAATPPDVVLISREVDRGEGWTALQAELNKWGIPVLNLGETSVEDLSTGPLPETPPALDDAEIKRRIDGLLQARKLHEALVIENARLAAERLHDPTTGLFNRRYIMIRMEEEIKRSSRHTHPLACLMLDIDKFEELNATWGQITGDGVLRDVAHVMTRTLRATDIVSRYQGDQFMALLTDTGPAGAQVAANRLRDAVADYNFFNSGSPSPIKLTASIGIAYWQPAAKPGEGTWEPELIALAERALRAAKLSGPNRLVMLQAQ
ncbi:MAG: diguanylate cyclase [Chloroflexota bacterium]|nr:diguanylate cyclase [Chloroflexota bacterium]